MGNGCRQRRYPLRLIKSAELPTYRRCSHCSTISPRIIRNSPAWTFAGLVVYHTFRAEEPLSEASAIPSCRIRKILGILDHDVLKGIMCMLVICQQPVSDRYCHDCIICKSASARKERKVRSLDVVKLIYRADDITY